MKVAILQSCYIPWKGYFDIIGSVDRFVVYDDVQYRKNHWHNRNIVKSHQGPVWLTVPTSKVEGSFKLIDQVTLPLPFAHKHWQTIRQSYSRAPFFRRYEEMLASLYEQAAHQKRLSELNFLFLHALAEELELETEFHWSSKLAAIGERTERLVAICRELGATCYLSGPSARDYIEKQKFEAAGIEVQWMDYSGYAEYPQLHGPFEHAVSIIDLLLNTGPDARKFMKAPYLKANA